jgi:hypothetical protein
MTCSPLLGQLHDILIDGESPSGYHWRFTPTGAERATALGLD